MERALQVILCLVFISSYAAVCLALGSSTPAPIPQGEAHEFGRVGENGITSPRPICHPTPEYTDKARKKKINGVVLLSLVVTPEGAVRDARITTSLDKDLDQQALKTVNTWKFQPATKDGKPVAVRIAVEISFRVR